MAGVVGLGTASRIPSIPDVVVVDGVTGSAGNRAMTALALLYGGELPISDPVDEAEVALSGWPCGVVTPPSLPETLLASLLVFVPLIIHV